MFGCSQCNISCFDQKEFLNHMKFSHTQYTCLKNCPRNFSSFESLRKHFRLKHDVPEYSELRVLNESLCISKASANVANICEDDVNAAHRSSDLCANIENVTAEQSLTLCFSEESSVDTCNDSCNANNNSDTTNIVNPLDNVSVPKKKRNQSEMLYAAKLYSYSDVARSRTKMILSDTKDLFMNLTKNIERNIIESVSNNFANDKIIETFKGIVSKNISEMSESLTSEHCIFRTFEDLHTYIKPQSYKIGERDEFITRNGITTLDKVSVTAELIPLRRVLKAFFEIPNLLDETLNYMDELQRDNRIVSNFIQSRLWASIKAKPKFIHKLVFPIFLYFDDYETNNPLGSHRGISKCGAVYILICCLPPDMQAKLENIFLFILFNTLDRSFFKNKIIFQKAIEELNYLENIGITINCPNGDGQLYFKLCLILGDNLGLNEILGFNTSFNASMFCRFCRMQKKDMGKIFVEDESLLRNRINYEKDLARQDSQKTGIVENCVFHALPDWHVTDNFSVDVTHDDLEGAAQYDLGLYLYRFMKVHKFFTLIELNRLIKGTNYGDEKNIPPEITEQQILKKVLKMTAGEMLCFLRHIKLIIGHLIPEHNKEWQLLKTYCSIVDISVSNYVYPCTARELRLLISDYLEELSNEFPGHEKPKHHLKRHHPRIMSLVGPLWKINSIRCEAKHREGKTVSRVSLNRKNVCHTIAIKHQLQFNYRLMQEAESSSVNESDNLPKLNIKSIYSLSKFPHVYDKLPNEMLTNRFVSVTNSVNFENHCIKNGTIIMLPEENGPEFYKALEIIYVDKSNFMVTAEFLLDVFLDEHTDLYLIYSQNSKCVVLSSDSLYGMSATHCARTPSGKTFIVKNWF